MLVTCSLFRSCCSHRVTQWVVVGYGIWLMTFLMWAGGLKRAAERFNITLEILNCAANERFFNFFRCFWMWIRGWFWRLNAESLWSCWILMIKMDWATFDYCCYASLNARSMVSRLIGKKVLAVGFRWLAAPFLSKSSSSISNSTKLVSCWGWPAYPDPKSALEGWNTFFNMAAKREKIKILSVY